MIQAIGTLAAAATLAWGGAPLPTPSEQLPPALAAPAGSPEAFRPTLALTPPGGPETLVFTREGSGVAALRLTVPLGESADEAGAGQIIRVLAEDRMRAMARRIGAYVGVHRTPAGLVYEVSGPSSEIDFLVWILNEGLTPPEAGRFNEVRRDQLAEVMRRQETPQGVLALRLRAAAGGGETPLLGTAVALERMHAGVVTTVWARFHARDRVRLVVVGDLAPEVALAATADLALPDASPDPVMPPGAAVPDVSPRPEIIRHWVARGWPLDRARDPRGLVAVSLLGERIREGPGSYELGAELWETGGRWMLVVSGAAYPRGQQAMRSRLNGLLAEAAEGASDAAVRRLAADIRADILVQASTPSGFAELVGQALDAGEPAESAGRILDELAALDGAALAAFFQGLQARTPLSEELRP
jgi:hypothetical protein